MHNINHPVGNKGQISYCQLEPQLKICVPLSRWLLARLPEINTISNICFWKMKIQGPGSILWILKEAKKLPQLKIQTASKDIILLKRDDQITISLWFNQAALKAIRLCLWGANQKKTFHPLKVKMKSIRLSTFLTSRRSFNTVPKSSHKCSFRFNNRVARTLHQRK